MQKLASKFPEEKVCVAIHSEGGSSKPELLAKGSRRKGKKLPFAAILALYIALKSNIEQLFAKRVSYATPKTVQELKGYLQPPLIPLMNSPF
jgi:hypothetical protein